MTTTIDQLTTPLTVDECKTAIYTALASRGVSTTGWKPGAVVRTIIAGIAIILAAFSQLQAAIARSGFLDLAEEKWLTLLAHYVYGVERDQGSFATGVVVVDNGGGGVYSGDPGDLVFVSPSTGQAYRNTASFSIVALATGVEIPVQAVELGSVGTATPNTITVLQTALLGLTATNPNALVGSDPETDAILRTRCREKLATASPNGPRDAYSYFARSAKRADGSSIGVTRTKVIPDGFGTVNVFVATATGTVTGDPDDPNTDLGAIADAIHEWAEPIAVTPVIQSAVPVSIAVTYELWVRNSGGLTDAMLADRIAAALVAFMSEQPIGGDLIPSETTGRVYLSAIEAAIDGAVPDGTLVRRVVTLPTAAVDLAANAAPVLGTVTVAGIHQISGEA